MASTLDHGQSTPESTEDDSNGDHWHQFQDEEEHAEHSTADEAQSGGTPLKQPMPMQKRRRVTRACDECRRKKIKCDGKQPCTHCTVYSYDCTYDQPSNRRRNPAPQYIEALEHRLQKAEALLKTVLPNVDLSTEEGIEVDALLRSTTSIQSVDTPKSKTGAQDESNGDEDVPTVRGERDSLLESMVETTGQLDLDDQGKWDFHGHSSGLTFLSRIREQFGDIITIPDMRTSAWLKPQMVHSSQSASDSPLDANLPNVAELPSKELALELASNSLDYACSLLRFMHQPSFYRMLDRVYSLSPTEFGDEENRFLPQLYVVLALGCLFAPNEKSELEQGGYENAMSQGFKYFLAGRQMMEITDCRDLTSLQAMLFMIMFLQSSAKLSTCYSYIGIALRSALRMGLHRSIIGKFNPVELETRKRVFWVIRKMDIYVAALLGLPKPLNDEDIDQDLPLEIDDEFITTQGILPVPPGHFSTYAASNSHTKLVQILAKVIQYVYPIKGPTVSREACHSSYVVSHAKIREVERDLHEWRQNLPTELQPGSPVPPDIERVQQLLRMAYAHVQMLLYRPFLHYASQRVRPKEGDKRSYACAAACISVSRNVIHITSNMKSRGLLIGAYWLTMYTTFFAIISLVFYVLENPNGETSAACFRDASEGKEALASLARRSNAADRCMTTLNTLFAQLPARLNRDRSKPVAPTKKRSAPTTQPPASKPAQSHTSATFLRDSISDVRRANTFPAHLDASAHRASVPNDGLSHRRELLSTDSTHRRSLHEFSPISSSPGSGTPDSNPGAIPLSANFGLFQQPSFGNSGTGVPELAAMMFPSDDPFAYPNQPMSFFENNQGLDPGYNSMLDQSPNGTLFTAEPSSNDSPHYDMEAQLFGPMAPYMMQGQPVAVGPQQQLNDLTMAGLNSNPDEMYQPQQSTDSAPGVNMDEIFSGEEWNNLLMEQTLRQ